MPSGKKTLPKSRKRVTASARARISVSKARKVANKGSDGSYLQDKETVSNITTDPQPSTSSSNSDAIMSMLFEINESNADLARRLDKVEKQNSTPIIHPSHSLGQAISPHLAPSKVHYHVDTAQARDQISKLDMGQSHPQPQPPPAHHST